MSRAHGGRRRPGTGASREPVVPRQAVRDESTKRELVFLVADKGMEAMIGTFVARQDFPERLGCARFAFDPRRDIVRAGGHDPGLVKREAGKILNRRRHEYRRAIVVVDHAYDGAPPPETIRERIAGQLDGVWEQFDVIVIDPELENWFWVDYPDLLKRVLLWTAKGADRTPRQVLEDAGLWAVGAPKPEDPKRAVEFLYEEGYTDDKSNGIFKRLAQHLPAVRRCTDDSFQQLMSTLAEWFPAEAARWTRPADHGTDHTDRTEYTQ